MSLNDVIASQQLYVVAGKYFDVTVSIQSNSHKSVLKLFHNLPIIFSNSLMGFRVICQLEKEPLKGLANVRDILS